MNRCIYRNFYYIKESIAEFFYANKKYLFISIISLIIGFSLGLCVGINNCSSFTFLNCSDKLMIALLCKENWFWFFVKQILQYLFFVAIILFLTNFKFMSFVNYLLFGFLVFRLIINCIIFGYMLGFCGILFSIIYFLIKIIIIFLMIVIFIACKSASNCSCGSSNFSSYPIKAILVLYGLIIILCLLLTAVGVIFSKFVSIII